MTRKLFYSFALIAIVNVALFTPAVAQSRSDGEIFQLVNRERAKARLGSLIWSGELAGVARDYSRRMAREGFFDHYDPNGKTVIDRAESVRKPNWSTIGENLFFCDPHPNFAETTLRGWMESRTHRSNMLDRGWTDTGIGIATARDGSIFITQVFTRE
jgi:uncharacterized protein YkwD